MYKKTKISKIINGKNKIIYKKDGDRIQYVKHNDKYIKLQEYRKMFSKSKSKKIIGGDLYYINKNNNSCEIAEKNIDGHHFQDNNREQKKYYEDQFKCENALGEIRESIRKREREEREERHNHIIDILDKEYDYYLELQDKEKNIEYINNIKDKDTVIVFSKKYYDDYNLIFEWMDISVFKNHYIKYSNYLNYNVDIYSKNPIKI